MTAMVSFLCAQTKGILSGSTNQRCRTLPQLMMFSSLGKNSIKSLSPRPHWRFTSINSSHVIPSSHWPFFRVMRWIIRRSVPSTCLKTKTPKCLEYHCSTTPFSSQSFSRGASTSFSGHFMRPSEMLCLDILFSSRKR